MTVAAATGLALVGHELEVPCSDGSSRPYVHLDHAASTPAIEAARAAADAILPWYASAHRGAGPKSRIATAAYEGARQAVAQLVGVRDEHDLVLVRNTTEGLNVLASALPPGSRILCTPVEHHANLLPWRRHDVRMLPFPRSADDLLALVEAALVATRIDVVAVTGASNVTGEVWPIAALARLAHAHGAELAVDAAQLAPHRPLDVTAAGIDYLALSGHKLYAPYGAGAHVLRRGGRAAGAPLLQGGGAAHAVGLEDVVWSDAPARYEAGSPNVVGAVALGAACDALAAHGLAAIAAEERQLLERLEAGLDAQPGVRRLRLWPEHDDRLGVVSFATRTAEPRRVAARLGLEHAIGVRAGAFCAHPLLRHLHGFEARTTRTNLDGPAPVAVRASIGLGVTAEAIDAFLAGLADVLATPAPPAAPVELPLLSFRLAAGAITTTPPRYGCGSGTAV